MDPFTLALATFGVQKLRGKSTRSALQSAALVGGASYGIGQLAGQGALGAGAQQPGSFLGSIGKGGPFSSLGFNAGTTGAEKNIFQRAIGEKRQPEALKKALEALGSNANPEQIKAVTKQFGGSGFQGLGGAEKLFVGTAAIPIVESLTEGEEEAPKPLFTEEDYKKAREQQSSVLQGGFQPVQYPGGVSPYASQSIYQYNKGGLAEIKRFKEGGINYLPSKISHDENDIHNYIKASGYVEDGSGTGNKNEDTMLAQLADGEFVSRADAVLGAGILSGASPRNIKEMRNKGADFFYDQQKKFKRIFDLINASKAD